MRQLHLIITWLLYDYYMTITITIAFLGGENVKGSP